MSITDQYIALGEWQSKIDKMNWDLKMEVHNIEFQRQRREYFNMIGRSDIWIDEMEKEMKKEIKNS